MANTKRQHSYSLGDFLIHLGALCVLAALILGITLKTWWPLLIGLGG